MKARNYFDHIITALVILCAAFSLWTGVTSHWARDTKALPATRRPNHAEWSEITSGSKLLSVVIFSDVQCPACRALAPQIARARNLYQRDVRFHLRAVPLSYHKRSREAALLIECAATETEQWMLHDYLLEIQERLNGADLLRAAHSAGIRDTAAMAACARSNRPEARVQRTLKIVERLRMVGTPTLIVDGEYVEPPDSSGLIRSIENARALRGWK